MRLGRRQGLLAVAVVWAGLLLGRSAHGGTLGTDFTYQGRLKQTGAPVTGDYDLEFRLYGDPDAGAQVGTAVTLTDHPVANGLFTAPLDFGAGAFDGSARWLQIVVEGNTLTPRQKLTAAPYALCALSALEARAVQWAGVVGAPPIVSSLNGVTHDGDNIDLVAGSGINIVPDDGANTITIEATGGLAPFWSLGGNAGTSPPTDFLGTTDPQALYFRVNNIHAMRFEPGLPPNVIGGFFGNTVSEGVRGGTIGGGGSMGAAHSVTADFGTVGGGEANEALAEYATVGGGSTNLASSTGATVGGGIVNHATAPSATVGGGASNQAAGENATVAGGSTNAAQGRGASVGGGEWNLAAADYATVAGGGPPDPNNPLVTNNRVFDNYGTIGGGGWNRAGDDDADPTSVTYATIGGGFHNAASGKNSSVGGRYHNTASDDSATVGGGDNTEATAPQTTVSGGLSNTASGLVATVGGAMTTSPAGTTPPSPAVWKTRQASISASPPAGRPRPTTRAPSSGPTRSARTSPPPPTTSSSPAPPAASRSGSTPPRRDCGSSLLRTRSPATR